MAHATHEIGDVTTHVVEVHDSKGKWVGDVSPDRATTLLNRFTIATRDPHLRGRLIKPNTFPHELGLLLQRYRSGKMITGSKTVK